MGQAGYRTKCGTAGYIPVFYGIGAVGHIAYSMAYLRIRVAICLLLHDGVAVALYPHYLRHDALS